MGIRIWKADRLWGLSAELSCLHALYNILKTVKRYLYSLLKAVAKDL